MKSITFFFTLLLSVTYTYAQEYKTEKAEIHMVINQFRKSIVRKDTIAFLSLFTKNSFNWVGVVKNRSQRKRIENKTDKPQNYFPNTYSDFYEFLLKKEEQEEIFENIEIINDDVIGSVTFDYSYWSDQKMTNWGKEFWHLIKINREWKIINVTFSIEMAKYFPRLTKINQ